MLSYSLRIISPLPPLPPPIAPTLLIFSTHVSCRELQYNMCQDSAFLLMHARSFRTRVHWQRFGFTVENEVIALGSPSYTLVPVVECHLKEEHTSLASARSQDVPAATARHEVPGV